MVAIWEKNKITSRIFNIGIKEPSTVRGAKVICIYICVTDQGLACASAAGTGEP